MKRVVLGGALPSVRHFVTVMTQRHVVLDVNGRVCIAHDRWMTRAEVAELHASLGEYLRSVHGSDHGAGAERSDGDNEGDSGRAGREPDQAVARADGGDGDQGRGGSERPEADDS